MSRFAWQTWWPLIDIEERWYAVEVLQPAGRWTTPGRMEVGNRQFVVPDTDGYLLRFYSNLGWRPPGPGLDP